MIFPFATVERTFRTVERPFRTVERPFHCCERKMCRLSLTFSCLLLWIFQPLCFLFYEEGSSQHTSDLFHPYPFVRLTLLICVWRVSKEEIATLR